MAGGKVINAMRRRGFRQCICEGERLLAVYAFERCLERLCHPARLYGLALPGKISDAIADHAVCESVETGSCGIETFGPAQNLFSQFLRNILSVEAGNSTRMRKARGADINVAIDARRAVDKFVKVLHGFRLRPGGRARGPEYPAPAKFRYQGQKSV